MRKSMHQERPQYVNSPSKLAPLIDPRPHWCRRLRILEDPDRPSACRLTRTIASNWACITPNSVRRCRTLACFHCKGHSQLANKELYPQEPIKVVWGVLQIQEGTKKRDSTGWGGLTEHTSGYQKGKGDTCQQSCWFADSAESPQGSEDACK